MRTRTLSVGGATYDLFLTMHEGLGQHHDAIQLKIGHKLAVDSVTETCGGGACNTSVGLSRLGLTASFCGIIGSDQWGEKLFQTMKKEGVNTVPATVVENETSSFSIILSLPGGERTILYAPGANEHLHDTTFDVSAIQKTDALYLNHLCEKSCEIVNDIVKTATSKAGLFIAWNPGGTQITEGMNDKDTAALLRCTSLLLLNKEEAIRFTETKNVEDAMKKLLTSGAKNICITDGKNGTHGSDGKHLYHCPILPNVKVIDTTGAGDAFGTGACWALLAGKPLQESMKAGTLNAASVVGTLGAQAGLLRETEMHAKLSSAPLTVQTL